jgi:ferrous iron transport protein B
MSKSYCAKTGGSCHQSPQQHRHRHGHQHDPELKIALVGSPNVGKSSLFHRLTGRRVIISNYPGTTVDVFRGQAVIQGRQAEVVDTPGMYSLHSITEEERVARAILLKEKPDVILHVVDAKNLERMLPLTYQLIEGGLPVLLVLNMMDETEALGIDIEVGRLSSVLGIPVVTTSASLDRGITELKKAIASYQSVDLGLPVFYEDYIEKAVAELLPLVRDRTSVSLLADRAVALLLLRDDTEIRQLLKADGADMPAIDSIISRTMAEASQTPAYILAVAQQQAASRLTGETVSQRRSTKPSFRERLSRAMMRPLSGSLILAGVLAAMYYFVGVFGAGTLVGWLEETVFGEYINPWLQTTFQDLIPVQLVYDLFVGDYGLITLGLTYAIGIILPIVTIFFIIFSMIEDSGYLPRLAMLVDRMFKFIGLNGRAVIPIVLGLGCDTMATIVTRTQETRRERVITTLLLALAIPCSAQLGVIFGILSVSTGMLLTWLGVVLLVFLLVGYLASKILPGRRASFYMEIPPLRLPRVSNVLSKTYARLEWYLKEVIPFFLLASLVLWAGDAVGLLDILINGLKPVIEFVGIPAEAAVAFIIGFFRRDFGAAGLYDLASEGILFGNALLVSAVVMTLFVPCIAQFMVMIKERGWKTALAIAGFIFPFAFLVGLALDRLLKALGVTL